MVRTDSRTGKSRPSTGTKAMRMPLAARRGHRAHAPRVLEELAPPPSKPMREEMEEFCEKLGVSLDWQQVALQC